MHWKAPASTYVGFGISSWHPHTYDMSPNKPHRVSPACAPLARSYPRPVNWNKLDRHSKTCPLRCSLKRKARQTVCLPLPINYWPSEHICLFVRQWLVCAWATFFVRLYLYCLVECWVYAQFAPTKWAWPPWKSLLPVCQDRPNLVKYLEWPAKINMRLLKPWN